MLVGVRVHPHPHHHHPHTHSPPPPLPQLWNIGILLNKQATLGKHFCTEYIHSSCSKILQ